MVAPILPLDHENLCSFRNVGIVGAWMLFPDDPKWRNKFIWNAAVLEGLDRLAAGTLKSVEFDPLVRLALRAASPDDIEAQWEERSARAYAAGMIVYNVCLRIPRGEARAMETAKREVERAIWGRKVSTSKHVEEAVWRKYRPVAALWAAFIFLDRDRIGSNIIFPCLTEDLSKFLERAEGYREWAEQTIPAHRKEPVLRPGESVRFSPEVKAKLLPGRFVTVQM